MNVQRIPALDWWSVICAGPARDVIDAMVSVGIKDVLHHTKEYPGGAIHGRVRATEDQIHQWSWIRPTWVKDEMAPATVLYHGVVRPNDNAVMRRPGSLCSYSRLGGPHGPWLPTDMPADPNARRDEHGWPLDP